MTLPDQSQRVLHVTSDHLAATRRAVAMLHPPNDSLRVDASNIDALAHRFGDFYIWHVEPGSAYRESSLLRLRMDEAGIGRDTRLAHGALGMIYALHTALSQDPAMPTAGVQDVRYATPVFEGAHLSAMIEPSDTEVAAFVVTTNQFEPNVAISGRLVYGPVWHGYDTHGFVSLAEQQLFTLEEVIGLVSALVGMWALESGGRALYMSQRLRLHTLLSLDDELLASGELVDRQPGRRMGERITAGTTVTSRRSGALIASGQSVFLYSADAL